MEIAHLRADMNATVVTRLLPLIGLLLGAPALAAPAGRAAAEADLRVLERNGPIQVRWPAATATPRLLAGPLAPPRAGGPETVARAFVEQHGVLFGLRDLTSELRLLAAAPTPAGTVVRYQQQRDGLPVYRAHLTIMVDGQGRVFLAQSSLAPAAEAPLPRPVVDADAARRAVAAAGAATGPARLAAVRFGAALRPCWVVYGRTLRPLGIWDYLVDAETGAVVGRRSRLVAVKGRVYTDSPAQGSPGLIDADLSHLTSADVLQGDYADVYHGVMNNWNVTADRKAVPVDGDYLFDPEEPSYTDPFSEVQAYYHITRIHQWFADSFGFARTTRGGDQMITTYVNVAEESAAGLAQFENAFYGDLDGDGQGDLVFGQGGVDFAYDAEVIYHEFTHSLIDEGPRLDGIDLDDLGMNLDPGSLNEGFADYFSSTLAGDPILGEYAGQVGDGIIRQLVDEPGETMVCRDVPLQGETHDDSMPWSRGLWDVRTALGAAAADQVIYAALESLPPDASFSVAAAAVVAVARQQLGDEAATTVESTFAVRNLNECSRLFPLESGATHRGYVFGRYTVGNFQIPHAIQYVIDVPDDATRLSFNLSAQGAQGGSVSIVPLVRRGDPVGVTVSDYSVGYTYDISGVANRNLVLTPDTPDQLLVPGQPHYLLVTNNGSDDAVFTLHVSLTRTPPVQQDAGPADTAPPAADGGVAGDGADGGTMPTPDRGCSCRAGASAAAGGLPGALLLLGLAVALRRWRRG